MKELDDLFATVQSQIHSIEHSLTQVDAYQQVRFLIVNVNILTIWVSYRKGEGQKCKNDSFRPVI